MTLDYLHVPVAILKLGDLNLRQKLLLGLVVSFGDKGLRCGNPELGDVLSVLPSRISDLLCELEAKGYIEIKNRQSRHRAIYFRPKSKVAGVLLPTESESEKALLSTSGRSTFDQSRNISKELKTLSNKKRVRAHFVKPTPAEVSEYGQSIGYALDGAYFCDRYEAGGWLVGRSPMKDWKAVVRTWRAREGKDNGNTRAVRAGSHPEPVGEFIR